LSCNNDESMKPTWEMILQDFYAKNEVPEDVLHDTDAFTQWWKSLDTSTQARIMGEVIDLSQAW